MMVTAIIAGLLLLPEDSIAAERAADKVLATVSTDEDFSAWQVSAGNQQASLGELSKWSDLLARHDSGAQPATLCINGLEAVCSAYGGNGLASMDQQAMTKAVRQINNAVNRLEFMADEAAFKKSDHWATPA
ncbi:MAG: hypothetical protein R3360_02180, partial [Alphaproteobacteria bacterium]|nr:hypothetical protein [Alphaproteobacteria bacterium]